MVFRAERHTGLDSGATPRLRFNGKRPLQELHPFLHANQTESSTLPRRFEFKARPEVAYREMNAVGCSPQLHFELPRSAVFQRIVQGLLQNPEKAERNIRR